MADEEPRTGELTTANYGWIKPTVGDSDDAWGGYLNSDLDGIDSVVHGIQTSIPTVPAASATAPLMDGTASAGSSAAWSRGDHAHPSDTTKYNTSNPSGYQTAGQVSASIAAAAYVLPTASTSILGGVRVDGSTIAINSGVISAAGASITVSDTPPSSPSAGALWFNSSVGSGGGQLYVFYSDGNSSQWVPTTNQMGGGYLPLQGVTNGSDAPPGQIGEVISSVVASPGVTLTTGVSAAVTSLSLTPGDWDVTGEVWIAVGAGGATAIYAGINSGPTVPGFQAIGAARSNIFATITGSQISVLPLRSCRVSLSAMTTYYLAVIATFPSGTTTAYGNIIARRAR